MRSSALFVLVLSTAAVAEPLVGPTVGNADVLVSEGNRLYNGKQYGPASDSFIKATRANPSAIAAYLGYARAQLAQKQLARACYGYKAWLKAAPDTAVDRAKVQSELELCERQKSAQKNAPPDNTAAYVDRKADFFAALEKKKLSGEGSAYAALKDLVTTGYLGADLQDMASKLNAEAIATAEATWKRALAHEKLSAEELHAPRGLYALASDVGPSAPLAESHAAFTDAIAELQGGDPKKAEALLSEAIKAEPSVSEYKYLRAMALQRSGDGPAALKALEQDFPDDPRTAVLRVSLALGHSPNDGAQELSRLLFQKRAAAK